MSTDVRTQAFRDALLAVLRDAEGPLTTAEVVKRVGHSSPLTRHVSYSRVYSNLRQLDWHGRVTWNRWSPTNPVVTWSAKTKTDDTLAQLEALWAATTDGAEESRDV